MNVVGSVNAITICLRPFNQDMLIQFHLSIAETNFFMLVDHISKKKKNLTLLLIFSSWNFKRALYSKIVYYSCLTEAALAPRKFVQLTPNGVEISHLLYINSGSSDRACYFSRNVFCKFSLSQFVYHQLACSESPGKLLVSLKMAFFYQSDGLVSEGYANLKKLVWRAVSSHPYCFRGICIPL